MTHIRKRVLPKAVKPISLQQSHKLNTLAGMLKCSDVVTLRDIRLPEFDKNRKIKSQKALVFDDPNCKYDIICGNDFLVKTGINFLYDKSEMTWLGLTLPMHTATMLRVSEYDAMVGTYMDQAEDE